MSKESPQDLDKLFQQEPEQYPFPYNEASWTEMEKLLDKDDRRRFLWWWFFGIGALLLIGSVFFFGKNETEIVDANLDLDKKEIVENQSQNQNGNQESNLNLNLNSESQASISDVENQIFNSEESNKNAPLNSDNISIENELNNSSSTSDGISQQYNYKKQNEDPSLIFNDFALQKKEIKNMNVSDSILGNANDLEDVLLLENAKTKTEEIDSVNILLQPLSVFPIASLQIFLQEKSEHFKIPSVEKKENVLPPPNKNENKFLYGFLIGTESTGTNRNNLSKLSWKIGAQLEYRFLNRYSASIGANFIQKKYGAAGSDYKPDPTSGSWPYGVIPTNVRAECDILEIPINIGFFQKGNNKNGFYSKLGLSTFIMLEEHYWYSYETPLPGQIRYWGGFNENKHWFGIGEVYVGYQHILSPITTMKIEPYFQIPLTGVGNGNVKLWSIGMNLRIDFQAN